MQNERITNNLNRAIETMRHALEEAERAVKNDSSATAIQRVFHSLTWGHANASSSIECAMAALQDEVELAQFVVK